MVGLAQNDSLSRRHVAVFFLLTDAFRSCLLLRNRERTRPRQLRQLKWRRARASAFCIIFATMYIAKFTWRRLGVHAN